jgi:hypothetical protein
MYWTEPLLKSSLLVSFAVSYCLYQLAKEKKTVFFESASEGKGWLFKPDGTVVTVRPPIEPYPLDLDDLRTFYLYDACGGSPREPISRKAFTIVAASPNNKHYKEFLRKKGVQKFYMPCWTWDEIRQTVTHMKNIYTKKKMAVPLSFKNEARIRKRYDKFGGIWHYIFDETDESDTKLKDAIGTSVVSHLKQTVGAPDTMPSVSHTLFQYDVPPNYKRGGVRFASDYIAERVIHHIFDTEFHALVDFLRATEETPSVAEVRGRIFEHLAHGIL